MVDDDIFLGRSVLPSDFYNDGKPYVWINGADWGLFGGLGFHRLYEVDNHVPFPTPLSAAPIPHFWYPELKSVSVSLENQYSEFYRFVGSHTAGHYSSVAGAVSDEHNSQEEEPDGFISWELLRTNQGIYHDIVSKPYDWWVEWWPAHHPNANTDGAESNFESLLKHGAVFTNVNDRFSTDPEKYAQEITAFKAAMEKYFPSQ